MNRMSRRVAAAALTVVTASSLAACRSTSAADSGDSASGTPSVKIMVGGIDKVIYLPAMLTQRLGYFKEQGLDVELSDEPAGVEAANQLLAGKVDGVIGFYDHTLDLQGKGRQTESVVQLLRLPGEGVLCRNDVSGAVRSPADWSGRKLGVTGLGSSTYFLTQYLATHNGVPTNKITPVAVKAGPTFVAAMKQKAIDCGMTTEPTVSQVLSDHTGFILLDMRTAAGSRQALGGTYPATSLYMTTAYVNAHKDVVQKLVNAYVATLKWIQGHNGNQIADVMPADYYAGVGKATYAKALDSEKGIFNPTGLMAADGPRTCLAVQDAFNDTVKGKHIDLSKTYTNAFVTAATPIS
jgi:NitT/TauT family transport system substrate-binding protein